MFLECAGLGRLDFNTAKTLIDFLDDVVHAQKVLIHLLQLSMRFFFPGLELGDSRGFLEDQASLFGIGVQHRGDASLLDDAVGVHADAGVEEQFPNVLEPGG